MDTTPLLASWPKRFTCLAFAQRLTAARRLLRYSLAVLFFVIALVARFGMDSVLPAQGFPFLTFFPAVLLAAYFTGLGPGLLTSALSILAARLFFLPADNSTSLSTPEQVAIVFFSAILLIDCLVIHFMKAALARVKRAELKLRESDHRLRLVLDNLYMFVGILDLNGTLREINEEPLRIAKLQREDILGRPLWEISWWKNASKAQNDIRTAIERAVTGETVRFDVEVGRSAQKFTLDFQVSPMRESDGKITALVASGVNVTARINAMAALQKSRREAVLAAEAAEAERRVLDAIFNAVPAGIIVADANGKMLRMNRAIEQIWGAAPFSETVSSYNEWKGWWADRSPRHGQPIQSSEWGLARSLKGEVCTDIVEVEPFGCPGERRVTLLSSAPVLNPGGQVVGGVVAQIDITERIRIEQALRDSQERLLLREAALREADRQKDEFLATLAHELRNPLAPIRTAVELIRLRDPADPVVQRARTIIERQVLHLTRLVDDLLDISRITLGNIELRQETLDLSVLVDDAIDAVSATLDGAGLAIEYPVNQPSIFVRGDAARLGQCLMNLLTNAAKFTPRGGLIGVHVAQEGALVVVEVSDTGSGITACNLEKIFDLFVQERPSGLNGNTGLGIGLALTRKLVSLHGGTVKAASAGQGQGSRFRIELPVDGPLKRAPPVLSPPAAPVIDGAKARVLVVEDNRDAADLLAEMLGMSGFVVSVAYSGKAALEAVAKNPPNAVLMDIGLPDIDGYEVCRLVRRLDISKQPVMIALTGWGNGNDRDRAAKAGFTGHLTKPAEPDQTIALLLKLINSASGANPQAAPELIANELLAATHPAN